MIPELKAGYHSTLDKYTELNRQAKGLSKMISFLRLIVFLIAAFLVYFFAANNFIPALVASLVFGSGIFIALMQYHSKILIRIKLEEAIIKINNDELSALEGNYSVFEDGAEFDDPSHPFSFDLDIFGQGSLFQFLNRTSTKIGREKLATVLQKPYLQPEIIIANQQAIAELKDLKEWRQDFQAIGLAYEDKKNDREKILNWVKLPPLFGNLLFSVLLFTDSNGYPRYDHPFIHRDN